MSEDLTREEVTTAVDAVVLELLEAARLTQPPIDAVRLAERHFGLALAAEARPRDRRHGPLTGERRQWLAARAIGERLKKNLFERLGLPTEGRRPTLGESPATLFALRLLLPTPWFAEQARGCAYDLDELRSLYPTVAPDVLAWRLLDLSTPCIITVVDEGAVLRRRCNVRYVPRELAPPERECQRQVHHSGQPHVLRSDGWTVQGWPVHHPDGKREILRSVVDTECD